ncbi:GGDEF domain-containing protein [Couchioplanes caeruleus]|uniref:GGDEF domain-containing protein n=1 Tax=Couchioplanes caeruleus TaxID=56438 RepID=UPI0011609820|nr:GGDEF domain-containing protein [Couchioplanes caeruleus]
MVAPRGVPEGRLRQTRGGAIRSLLTLTPLPPYLAATWPAEHRPVMAAIVGFLALCAVGMWVAAPVGRSRYWMQLHLGTLVVNTAGYAALGVLDGGVASPLGPLLPFAVMVYAVTMPPRSFLPAAALSAVAYWIVAIAGGPAPPGYAVVYTVAFGGISLLCLRYSGAMASLRRRLDALSRSDPLTGGLNRRGFDERLAAALAEADRTGEPVALLVLDLDRFKEVNDTYGHQAGDELLTWTARTLASQLRSRDAVGRLGGDEFAAVLSGVGAEEAADVAERLRAALDGVVTGSIGFACYPAEAADVEELRRHADERAYRDKTSRVRQLPPPAAVARARAAAAPAEAPRVSRHERRRRAIADSGRLGLFDPGVGLLYVVLFAAGHPHRLGMGLLLTLAGLIGLGTLRLAGPLSRYRHSGPVMFAVGVAQFGIAAAVVCLDGGAAATLALGLFAPLPLIALTTPNVGRPLMAVIVAGYLAIATFVGDPNPWCVVMHMTGALSVSVICAHKGRIAARQRRQLSRLSRLDALTGCLNRRGFTERFEAERSHAREHHHPTALLIFDLDGFKQVNDVHGHAAGDELLVWVAATLRAHGRPRDLVGRLGGDEFVMLLGLEGGETPAVRAEALRAALAERTACSVGAARVGDDGEDFAALYAHADAELYARKLAHGGGRSRRPSPPAAAPLEESKT